MVEPAKSGGQVPIPETKAAVSDGKYVKVARGVFEKTLAAPGGEVRALSGKAEITILVGTSSAGKSSIIKATKERIPDRFAHGFDLAGAKALLQFVKTGKEYDVFQRVLESAEDEMHIVNAIFLGLFSFKPNISDAEQKIVRALAIEVCQMFDKKFPGPEIDKFMLEDVLASGKSSILDVMEIDSIYKEVIRRDVQSQVKTALVYCPFKDLSERIDERNRLALEKKQYHEIRIGTFPFVQFAKLFGPKQAESDVVIEELSRGTVEKVFNAHFDAWVDDLKAKDPSALPPNIENKRTEDREALLKALGFEPSTQKVQLTPRFKGYDFLINSVESSADFSAQILAKSRSPS